MPRDVREVAMTEFGIADATSGRLNAAAALLICAAVVGIAYWSDRAYRRWWNENHPFAEPKASLKRMRTTYRGKRANVTEAARLIGDLLVEVARATAMEA